MADNINIKYGDVDEAKWRTTDTGGDVHVPHHARHYPDIPDTTGALSAVAQTVGRNVTNLTGLVLAAQVSAAAGASAVFEISPDSTDGTNGTWYGVTAPRSNALDTFDAGFTTISATPAYVWYVPVSGINWFRVRMTAITSGAVNIRISPCDDLAFPSRAATSVTATPPAATQSIINSAATTNGASLKTSGANLFAVVASNTSASPRFLKFYNLSTAPTVGTSAVALTLTIPANGFISAEFGTLGARFSTGLSLAITGAAADSDTTAIGAGEVKVITSFS